MLDQAASLHQKGRLAEAASLYQQILAANPQHADALHLLGVIEVQRKNASAGLELIDRAIAIDSNNAAFFSNRGLALQELKRFDEAFASFDRALAINPRYATAFINRGNVLRHLERFDDAVASYDRALAIDPNLAAAFNNRGNALRNLMRLDDALASYDRAVAINPGYADAHLNRGNTLRSLKRFDDAIASYDRALTINPGLADAFFGRGNALADKMRFGDAIGSYDRAISLKPDFADALLNRGNSFHALRRLEEALASYDQALAIKPDFTDALVNRGSTLGDLKRYEDALADYDRALAIEPDYPFLLGARLHYKMMICDWRGLAADFERLAEIIEAGGKASDPFPMLATPLSGALQRTNTEAYVRDKFPRNSLLLGFEGRSEHERIQLGYFSADFHDHAVARAIAGLIESHDRSKFEVIAVSFGPPATGAMRARLEKAFDRFVDVHAMPDEGVALLARNLEIDIAVDLSGFTQGGRTGTFAIRAAPIQVNYLGYPGTMGADYFDYIIADPTLIANERHFAEKIAYLPDTYMVGDSKRVVAKRKFTRSECGLPDAGFVFCCFNASYKITPEIFHIWMRLLCSVEGSVFWFPRTNDATMANLKREAEARSIGAARLVFAPFLASPEDHLARLKLADLFLDTLPYNAHATANDALLAGVPLLTCMGETFAGRVCASLLNAIGVPELITQDLAAYEVLALELATKPQMLVPLREKLAAHRLTRPLFDTARFTRHIEAAYMIMWQRYAEGLAPDHIHVQAESVIPS